MKDYLNNKFIETFHETPEGFLSCGGRFEVLGNHTDHNHGLCIAATCSLAIYGAYKKRDDKIISIMSEGYPLFNIKINDLRKKNREIGRSSALLRGIAYYLSSLGYQYGGITIYLKSMIPSGAGVSSSAAFELIIAQMYNIIFNEGKIPLIDLCKASQFAEREYYGKMCGLLDQIGVAYGGLTCIDFADINNPKIESLKPEFNGYHFVIVNSGGDHSSLSHLYAAIPQDMFKVANYFNKKFLREISKDELLQNKEKIILKCGSKAYQRALHFFEENERVIKAKTAIKENDIPSLINLINESRISSTEYLENMCVDNIKEGSPLEACELIMLASHNKAGVKINGGGFAGSVIALIPDDELDNVTNVAGEKYGKNNVHVVSVRNEQPSVIK